MHSYYLPNDNRIWMYDIENRIEYWNVDHLNKRQFLCRSWIWTSSWDIASFLCVLYFGLVIICWDNDIATTDAKLLRRRIIKSQRIFDMLCMMYLEEKDKQKTWDTDIIMWRGKVEQDWQPKTLMRCEKLKQNRIHNHPELKAAVSCPFRAQGVGAQLPAFPTVLDSTLAALRLPSGHEPVTPHHDETTCQCSLSDSCKSRSFGTNLNI